jgi:hypothetical protein
MERTSRSRDGADGDVCWLRQRAIAFLRQVVYVREPPSMMGLRYSRELEALVLIETLLAGGRSAALGDVAMQRFKAVQTSLLEGNWQTARRQELTENDGFLTRHREQDFTVRAEVRGQQLCSQSGSALRSGGSRAAVG